MRKAFLIVLVILTLVLGIILVRGFSPATTSPQAPTGDLSDESHASATATELYRLRNPYIGNASQNSRILRALLAEEETGPYHMELETSEEPYGLRVIFETHPEEPQQLDRLMARQGLLILALIDNADWVQWAYPPADGKDAVPASLQVTRDDLFAALSIEKTAFEITPALLDELL